jgi:hypothetical protein
MAKSMPHGISFAECFPNTLPEKDWAPLGQLLYLLANISFVFSQTFLGRL